MLRFSNGKNPIMLNKQGRKEGLKSNPSFYTRQTKLDLCWKISKGKEFLPNYSEEFIIGGSRRSLSPACSHSERQLFQSPPSVFQTSGGRSNTSLPVFTSHAAEGHKFRGEKVSGNTQRFPLSANHHANECNTPGIIWSKELSVRLSLWTEGRSRVAPQAPEAILILHLLDQC